MKRLMHNASKPILVLVWILLFAKVVTASNCPIIFLHGHESDPTDTTGWKTWRNPQSAMKKILANAYNGYSAGSPLECNKNSVLSSTGGETRKIYNFSYYHPDGHRGVISLNEDSVLVYFCHWYDEIGRARTYLVAPCGPGQYPPSSYDSLAYWPKYVPGLELAWVSGEIRLVVSEAASSYANSWKSGKYAKRLAEFIDKVLVATGSEKVDLVVHSMGGLVARSAIKNYGCASKIRKLLMVGTPNHPYDEWWEAFYNTYAPDKKWQKQGENLEMGLAYPMGYVDPIFGNKIDPYFKNLITGEMSFWGDILGYDNYIEGISTIAGNKGKLEWFYGAEFHGLFFAL
ncbi:MAG: esterase/lipase family protein [Bacteroidales bacterium]